MTGSNLYSEYRLRIIASPHNALQRNVIPTTPDVMKWLEAMAEIRGLASAEAITATQSTAINALG
jgi:hypothetical protein